MLRDQPHPADAAVLLLLAAEDVALAHHAGPVFKGGLQLHVRRGHRQHPAGDGQHLAHTLHGPVKAGHDAVQGRQKQVAEALACKAPIGKAVIEQLLHGRLRIGKRHNTVADIARRKHSEVLPEHTGAAAVVRDGHNRGDIPRTGLQAAQHGGQPVSTADGRDARLPAVRLIEPDLFCKIRHSNHLLPISRWLSVAA